MQLDTMRRQNPEWDFMSRTYMVLALANLAKETPAQSKRYLETIDRIITNTLRMGKKQGMHYLLIAYARRALFKHPSGHSLVIDGEIALMLAARRLIIESPEYKTKMDARVRSTHAQMNAGPVLNPCFECRKLSR